MRIASGRHEDDFEINVISLIDVLLTLLMFFVLTTTFVQHSRMQVTLPQAESTQSEAERDAFVVPFAAVDPPVSRMAGRADYHAGRECGIELR